MTQFHSQIRADNFPHTISYGYFHTWALQKPSRKSGLGPMRSVEKRKRSSRQQTTLVLSQTRTAGLRAQNRWVIAHSRAHNSLSCENFRTKLPESAKSLCLIFKEDYIKGRNSYHENSGKQNLLYKPKHSPYHTVIRYSGINFVNCSPPHWFSSGGRCQYHAQGSVSAR